MKWYNKDLFKMGKTFIKKKLNSWTDWFTNVYTVLFPTSQTSTVNNMTQSRTANTSVDLTFPNTVNYDLAMDLYYNTRAGYKLGAFFCFSIIEIPLTFMGFPHFDVEDWEAINNKEFWEERFEFYNKELMMDKQDIQKLCHITGTVGVFPWFDSKKGYVKLYFIKSKYISDIYTNPDTQELTGIVTSINYSFEWNDGKVYYFTEKKVYTKSKITTTRTGTFPAVIRASEIKRNPTGILPIMFTNDKEKGKFEGHSDLERPVSLIKSYAQVNLRAHEEAANMKAKLVLHVDNWENWKIANGITNITEISVENKDFIVTTAEEKAEIIVPKNLIDNHIKLMNVDFWNIVQTSKIPEIFWGLEASGNLASAGKQDKFGLAFVKKKQQQVTKPYCELAKAIIDLDAMAYNQMPPEVECTWDEFDTLTEVERAEVFNKWASGIEKLTNSHSIDMEGVHQILLGLTKNKITENFEEFKEQVKEFGTIRSMLDQEYGGMRDFENTDDDKNNKTLDGEEEDLEEKFDKNKGNDNGKKSKVFV